MRRVFAASLLVLTLGATGARSEHRTSDSLATYILSDTIVVTANRVGLSADQSVWPATVLNLDQSGLQQDFQQTLNGLGGLDLRQSAGIGSVATLSSWGSFNRHVLLLYNGRVVRDYSVGGFSLADFSFDEFDRVELLKGPQSAFYGSDAVGGIVNLISRTALADRVSFTTRQGSFSEHQYRLDASRKLGALGVGGFVEDERSANPRPNSGANRFLAGLRTDFLSADGHHKLTASARYFTDSLGLPGPALDTAESSTLHDHQTDRNYSLDAAYRFTEAPLGELQIDLFTEHKRLTYTSYPDNISSNWSYRSVTNKQSSGASARLVHQHSPVSASGGIDWLYGSVDIMSNSDFGFGPSSSHWTHAQTQLDLWSDLDGDLTRSVRLDLSGRLQFTHNRRTQPSYNAGVIVAPLDGLHVKLGYGYAFRLPSISDQFANEPYNIGSPKLRPEIAHTLALTASYDSPDRRITTAATYFDQRVDSLIRYVSTFLSNGVVRDSTHPIPNYINVDRFVSRGLDLSFTLRPRQSISFALSMVYQRARQTNDHGDFIVAYYVPSLKWRADLEVRPGRLFAGNLNVVYTADRHLNIYGIYPKTIGAVYTFGASVSARVNSYVSVALSGEDLTNRKRPDQFGFSTADRDYPSPGRRFTATLKVNAL